jgi:hypothetical protein
MPDIIMCSGEGCPEKVRENCYRYRAVPNPYRQSYFMEVPFHQTSGRCSYQIVLETKEDDSTEGKDYKVMMEEK